MEWTKFSTHGESVNHAFEVMCNILFEIWCRDTYGENLIYFTFINGKGGDGGVEAYGLLKTGEVVSIQSKWFPQRLDNSQFKQIENSFYTAVKIRPALKKYIVCIPRDFTSEKMTKSNRVSKNTEETKWNNLCKKLKIEYPDIIIELWDETTIQKRLLSPKAIGCYKYWFENSVVFENEILNSYKKALNGWAKIKYIPDLYSKGHIHGILGNFVGIPEIIEQRYDELKKVISQLLSLKQAYKDILRLNLLKKELPLKRRIESDIKIVSEWILKFENDIPKIKNGDLIIEDFDLKKFKLNCTVSDFKEHPLHFQYYLNFHPVEELLDTIHDDLFKCWQLLGNKNDNRMIILGDPGTGKTSGIVGETNWFLQERIHLSIMVRAKDFTEGDSWLSIIVKTIGLSSSWSEQELLRALENATLLRSNQFDRTDDIKVQPMCLICVDGIDESANCDFWKEKIAEAKTYEKDFSRIKFVFLSRPYVFPRYYELDYRDCFSRIPSSGDVAVTDIFDDYVNYYNIDIGVNIWIRNALRTPIALRLFCDLYQNQKIDILPQNSLVLTSLFKKKMESLEITFGRIEGVANRHEMVKTLLITIADLLISQDKVCYEVIEKECTSIIRNHLEPLLDFVEKEGFVFSFIKGEDPFSILETFYSWGIQPAFDYLIARKLYDSVKQGKEISSNYSQGILQMLSLIALEEDGKLLFQYENVKFNENEHFELVCFALANASIETVEKFADYVKKLMNVSAAQFRKIVDRIVIPVCRVENHPLGSVLLDDFLRSKKEPAKRDIWWSIPANLRNSYDAEWGCYTEINISDLILKGGSYMGAPLLLVWRLSSVDNDVRHECRAKLTEWGIENQSEFYQLVVYCADINDEQIIEDLFAIAYGISLSQNVEEDYLTSTSEWIINHVFSPSGLKCYENVAVRYYCGGIVKIALLKGVCDEKCLEKITPPYKCKENIMPIYKEALNSERLSGYGPIGYDLARYVLCDRLDRFFRENHKTNEYFEDTKQFLLEYKEKYGVEVKKPGGLIISIAYQYLLANGWEEKAFGGYKEKENIGVDTSIKRTYYSATHGKMSKVMTVAEKYVWIARHRMEAMFADRMRWYDYENGRVVVQDYLDLESFTNTYQDYIDLKQCKYNEQWFHKEQLAVTADEEFSLDNIQKWMHNDELLKFATWIKDNEGKYIIYACSNINNKKAGIEETLWISSGAVKRGEFKKFLRLLNVYSEDRSILQNVSEFHSYQKSSCYCTPQEVCTIQGDREIEDKILLGESGSTVEVYKLIESCLSENAEKGERSFYFPNRLVRKLTGITYGDGYQYLNSKGEIIGIYTDAGENFEDCQGCLLIDADVLTKAMCQGEYQMFWLFRDYRSPSGKVMEAHGYSIEHDTDRSFVVWFEGEECKFVELKDIEPLR